MQPLREQIHSVIKQKVRSRLTRRYDPKFGHHGVYLFQGVEAVTDEILALVAKDRKDVILKALVEGFNKQYEEDGMYADTDLPHSACLDGWFNLETIAELIDKALSDGEAGKPTTDQKEETQQDQT